MSGIIVLGSQWGDEGKGKLIDVFSESADVVIRSQGGANAGHTLVVDEQKIVLHLIPSGILHEKIKCIISAGVVLDLDSILQEIDQLKGHGYLKDDKQLAISEACTVLLPYHKAIDAARESTAKNKIGTTCRGIGPAYEDRASRRALVFGDLYRDEDIREKLAHAIEEKNFLLTKFYKQDPINLDELYDRTMFAAERLEPYRCRDASLTVHKYLKSGKKVLFEGAQGSLLDILHGTYPYVTSSSTLAGSACTGTGFGPGSVEKVVGITKAYTTRVGEGPFPTELNNEVGELIQKQGGEFGATTGRTRRCGWLDLVALRYSIRINGITNIALTKLDVFSGMDQIGVCTSYKLKGETIKDMPMSATDLHQAEPVVEWLPGWDESLQDAKTLADLPSNARNYIQFIGNEVGTPIDVISIGPGRHQTLWIKPLFQ